MFRGWLKGCARGMCVRRKTCMYVQQSSSWQPQAVPLPCNFTSRREQRVPKRQRNTPAPLQAESPQLPPPPPPPPQQQQASDFRQHSDSDDSLGGVWRGRGPRGRTASGGGGRSGLGSDSQNNWLASQHQPSDDDSLSDELPPARGACATHMGTRVCRAPPFRIRTTVEWAKDELMGTQAMPG